MRQGQRVEGLRRLHKPQGCAAVFLGIGAAVALRFHIQAVALWRRGYKEALAVDNYKRICYKAAL
ncbi:MAG: hypothetical protein H5T66_06775 [Chloroflexi bacterium]|nr:hypothetical protein [Chloroflexota bacterium]